MMGKFARWMKEEIIMAIPAILYFVSAFNLINFTNRLMFRADGLTSSYVSYFTATIGALVVVKVMIIVDALPHFNLLPTKPRIYSIVGKFLLYGTASLLVRIIDDSITYYFKFHDLSLIIEHLQIKLNSPFYWAIQLWLLMLFLGYVVVAELVNEMGEKKAMRLIFGGRVGVLK